MKLLLDTHTLLWLVADDPALSMPARAALIDPANDLVLSVASIWELAIKTARPNGPLVLSDPLGVYVSRYLLAYQIGVLEIGVPHALGLLTLPDYHRDPFDRILVAQALAEGMTLVSGDGKIAAYPVAVIW